MVQDVVIMADVTIEFGDDDGYDGPPKNPDDYMCIIPLGWDKDEPPTLEEYEEFMKKRGRGLHGGPAERPA